MYYSHSSNSTTCSHSVARSCKLIIGSLDLFTPSQSISVLRFIKQMFQTGMENAVRTCPYHEKRERNLNKGAVVTVDLLLEFSK